MRSPFAYVPRRGPLQAASPGAAVTYLGALTAVAFLYSSPLVLLGAGAGLALAGRLAGASRAVRTALRWGLGMALFLALVNALVVDRGETVLARLGEWPVFGRVDVTLEALVAGLVLGLRVLVALVASAVYSSCVDPDRVLRALRPLAGRSALTATLVSRLVPVAAADAARLREAARLRGPAAAPVGHAPLARRLLAGSLDRSVDVAATLELRGYSLEPPQPPRRRTVERLSVLGHGKGLNRRSGLAGDSRFDRRFYLVGVAVLAAAVAGKALGADDFQAYPTISLGVGPATVALSALLVLSGLAPWRRNSPRRASSVAVEAASLRGPAAAPVPGASNG